MLKVISLVLSLLSIGYSAPIESSNVAPAAYGIDTTLALTDSIANCLRKGGYTAGFYRIGNKGTVDNVGIENAYKSNKAGLKFELFVSPNPSGYADRQFNDAHDLAKKNNINLERMWLQITSPIEWDKTVAKNVKFINDFVKAGKMRNIKVGFYTNWYDFEQITGNSRSISPTEIWFWHVLGAGNTGASSRDYSDFRPFGPFKGYPLAKQYAIGGGPCNFQANRNVFAGNKLVDEHGEDIIPIGLGASFMGREG